MNGGLGSYLVDVGVAGRHLVAFCARYPSNISLLSGGNGSLEERSLQILEDGDYRISEEERRTRDSEIGRQQGRQQ